VDFETFIDEITRATKKKTEEFGKEMLSSIIIAYDEHITKKICDEKTYTR
jgi:hypothetical protein